MVIIFMLETSEATARYDDKLFILKKFKREEIVISENSVIRRIFGSDKLFLDSSEICCQSE